MNFKRLTKSLVVPAGFLFLTMSLMAQKPAPVFRWENFGTVNGMPDEKVMCVAVDGDNVWAGTENGLVLINKGQIKKIYKPEDGLVNRVVTGLAGDHETGDV